MLDIALQIGRSVRAPARWARPRDEHQDAFEAFGADDIWALVVFVTVLSIVVHGLTASIALRRIDAAREERATPGASDPAGAGAR